MFYKTTRISEIATHNTDLKQRRHSSALDEGDKVYTDAIDATHNSHTIKYHK